MYTKKVELYDESVWVHCSWCRKNIDIDALCCPHCHHDGPSLPWKKELKHFSFELYLGKERIIWLRYFDLSVSWEDSCGQKMTKHFSHPFDKKTMTSDGSSGYLMEIDVPANAHITVSVYNMNRDNEKSFYQTRDGLPVVLSDSGKYAITMFTEVESRLLIPHHITYISVNRIS